MRHPSFVRIAWHAILISDEHVSQEGAERLGQHIIDEGVMGRIERISFTYDPPRERLVVTVWWSDGGRAATVKAGQWLCINTVLPMIRVLIDNPDRRDMGRFVNYALLEDSHDT